jgi:hypothetical protein
LIVRVQHRAFALVHDDGGELGGGDPCDDDGVLLDDDGGALLDDDGGALLDDGGALVDAGGGALVDAGGGALVDAGGGALVDDGGVPGGPENIRKFRGPKFSGEPPAVEGPVPSEGVGILIVGNGVGGC